MDFFEAQARAKKSTSRLVALFALAVLGTVLGGYGAAVFALRQTHDDNPRRSGRSPQLSAHRSEPPSWWQPQLFLGVSSLTLAVVGLASLYKWNEFSAGGSAVAESVGGRRVDPHTTDTLERRLLNVVEEMAIASGVPMPAVYIMDEEPAINAFAAGLNTSDAVVAVTRGTLEKLSRDELQGVVGHEFSHILNGDMRLNMRLTALVFGILVLGLAGRGILWTIRFQSLAGSRDREGKNSGGMLIAIGFVGLALLVLGYVGYFFGRLIQAAVSRQREYLADASAVQFTRNPGGLSGALKKIGGFALGSSIQSNQSGAIGHFFFAQGFRSHFGGLWATHPPLDERIRAIDPQFNGQMIAPPDVVDVARESFVTAGLAPARTRPAVQPTDVLASVGTLTPALLAEAPELHAALPPRLLAAAHAPSEAPTLLYGLLIDNDDDNVQRRQLALIARRAGGEALHVLESLDSSLRDLGPEHKLPLLQLALPALKTLRPSALAPFFETLDALVHADGRVSPFEFALQKLLLRHLAASRAPARASMVQFHSFKAVADEISTVLSILAHSSDRDSNEAYAAGAAQLPLLAGHLGPLALTTDLVALDVALDKLAAASGPIKQRLLQAAAYVVISDGEVHVEEYELLRAIAATLDVPLPPLPA